MTGNVHYRIVFSSRPGLTECKDILVDEFEVEADGSISEEAARAVLFRRDGTEHLVVIGPSCQAVVETGISPPAQDEAEKEPRP